MFPKKMTRATEPELSNLSWEADIVLNSRTSERTAWRVAIASLIVVFLMAIALILLLPLKQVVPYVVVVDKLTGETSVATTTKDFVTSSALNDKHWVKTFLISRERYSYRIAQHDYNTIRLLAGDKPWATYAKLYEGEYSLDKKYGENTEIIPSILSITLNGDGLATVRYELRTTDGKSIEPVIARRIATLRYQYIPQSSRREVELIDNPLGFTVLGYQTDPEFTAAKGEVK